LFPIANRAHRSDSGKAAGMNVMLDRLSVNVFVSAFSRSRLQRRERPLLFFRQQGTKKNG
jgi:hypothetical protein